MPGDDDHLLQTAPNPYVKFGFAKLKRMLDAGLVPDEHVRGVQQALILLADGQALTSSRPCIAVDHPTRPYNPYLGGDEDVCDLTGEMVVAGLHR